MSVKRSFLHCLLPVIIIVTFGIIVYSNSLHAPFVFDDKPHISDNPLIRIESFDIEKLYYLMINDITKRRPLTKFTFAMNYLFGNYNVEGYHVFNIIIHLINGILVFLFFRKTLMLLLSADQNLQSAENRPTLSFHEATAISLCAAIIWIVHPLHTQSVTYIVQRMNSMATMFYLTSFLFYIQGRLAKVKLKSIIYFGCCVFGGVCALGSKQIAATLPLFIFIYEWFFFQHLDRHWLRRSVPYILGITMFIAALGVFYFGINPLKPILAGYGSRDFTLFQRVLTEFRVVILYISLILFPHPSRLTLDYDYPLSYSFFNPPTTFFSLFVIAGLIVVAILTAKKERLLSFCILWFFGNLVLESSILPLELVFEHRTYLPSIMLILLFVLLAYRYVRPKWINIIILFVVVSALGLWTYQRNAVWSDGVAFAEDCVQKAPHDARCQLNLGYQYITHGMLDKAEEALKVTITLDPKSFEALNNLGNVYARKGMFDKAIDTFLQGLEIESGFAPLWQNIGNVFKEQGKYDDAIRAYMQALEIYPSYAEVRYELAGIMNTQGLFMDAINEYKTAIRIDPRFAAAHHNLGNVYHKIGDLDNAEKSYRKALEINPGLIESHNNIGNILYEKGRVDEAIQYLKDTLCLKPESEILHYNLGNIYFDRGNMDDAYGEYVKVLRINPHNKDALFRVAKIHEEKKQPRDAIKYYKKILEIDPGSIETWNNLANAFHDTGELDEAISAYKSALVLDAENALLHFNLANTYLDKGLFDDALEHYIRCEKDKRVKSRARYRIYEIYHKKGYIKNAIDYMSALVREMPDNYLYHYKLGNLFLESGRYELSREQYSITLSLRPDHADTLNNLAIACMRLNDFTCALECLLRKVELQPDLVDGYYNIACLYSKQNKNEEVYKWLMKAIEHGFTDWHLLETDADLVNFRKSEQYNAMIKTYGIN